MEKLAVPAVLVAELTFISQVLLGDSTFLHTLHGCPIFSIAFGNGGGWDVERTEVYLHDLLCLVDNLLRGFFLSHAYRYGVEEIEYIVLI